jgi:hypothetical protein
LPEFDPKAPGSFVASASGAKKYKVVLVAASGGVTADALQREPGYSGAALVAATGEVPDAGGQAEIDLGPLAADIGRKASGTKVASFVVAWDGSGKAVAAGGPTLDVKAQGSGTGPQGAMQGVNGNPQQAGGAGGSQTGANAGQSQQAEDLPPPIPYAGGADTPHGISTPGTVKFIKAEKPPQPTFWASKKFGPHAHFAPEYNVDTVAGDIYGPAQTFTVTNKFIGTGFGGMIVAELSNGAGICFGHFDQISVEVHKAAKSRATLPAGTFLGRCSVKIGLSAGPHCHIQCKKGGAPVKRKEWLPWLGNTSES